MNTETQNELIPTGPGDVLRHKRQQSGIGLEQAAKEVRIRLDHLVAIESGDTQHIPQVYLNGYIRSYARYLGLPAGAIDQHLIHAKGSEPIVQSVFSVALPKNPNDRWFKATSYVLASVVVIALVWQFTAEAVRFSQGEPVARPGGSDSTFDGVEGSPAESNTSKNKSPVATKSHLQASIAPLEGVQPKRPQISQSGAEGAWSAITQAGSDAEPKVTLLEGQQSFRIAASADSWIEIVDGNGKKVEMDLLRAGNERNYVAIAPVKLLLGRASSIELSNNGEPIDLAPYTRGNVARITLGDMAVNPVEAQDPALEPDAADEVTGADSPQD
ncbi:MAG: DUF4115 domain-containing protein [Xanthomonadales bacterium]|nr:DUF4115 domain-containing protein [Xanthomonadales bacterium]